MSFDQRAIHKVGLATNTDQDFTVPGFGTPDAVMLVFNYGATQGVDSNDKSLGVGLFDGVNSVCAMLGEDNLATASASSRGAMHDNRVCHIHLGGGSGELRSATAAMIADGVRLTWAGSDLGSTPSVLCWLIKNAGKCAVVALETSGALDGVASVSGLSFQPNSAIGIQTRRSVINTHGNNPGFSIGYAFDGKDQRCYGYALKDNPVPFITEVGGRILESPDRIGGEFLQGGGTAVQSELTAWNVDGVDVTTRASANNGILGLLLMDIDETIDTFLANTTSTAGWDPYTGTFQPQCVFMISTRIDPVDTSRTDHTPGFLGVYIVNDDGDEWQIGGFSENTVATRNCGGRYDNKLFRQTDAGGAYEFSAESPTFDATGLVYSAGNTLEHTDNRRCLGFAIGATIGGGGGGVAPKMIDYKRQRQ